VRRRRKGFAYASSVSGWHPDNVIALAMVCCCASRELGRCRSHPTALGSLKSAKARPGGGVRARRGLPYFHNSSGTAAALNLAKSFAAIRITTINK